MAFPTELRVMAQRAARQLAEYKKRSVMPSNFTLSI